MSEDKKVTVLAIGGAGCRVMTKLQSLANDYLRLLAIDTDRKALESCPIPEENKLLAAENWRNGHGCGGSEIDGQRSIAHERTKIDKLLRNTEMLIVIGGLGGGTASGGTSIIKSITQKLKIPTLFLMTTPFSLEGNSRRQIADGVLRAEFQRNDVFITLPNDLLFSVLPSSTKLTEAFALADVELASTVLALSSVVQQESFLSTNFDNIAAVLCNRKSHSCLGSGVADATDASDGTSRCQVALEKMLQSPLLGGIDKLKSADTVIFSLIGGPDLSLGETRLVLEQMAKQVNPSAKLLVGATANEAFADRVQLCALAVKFDKAEELDVAMDMVEKRNPRANSKLTNKVAEKSGVEQLSFMLDIMSKGIMDKCSPVVWMGEDLDYPTFQRKNISIDKGKEIRIDEELI